MKVLFLGVGKTISKYLIAGEADYISRLKHYIKLEYKVLPSVKKASSFSRDELKKAEAALFLRHIQPDDFLVLLDEHGNLLTSVDFSEFLQKKMNQSVRQIVFVVGGAFGFSPEMLQRAQYKISLSPMTFSHQMVRMIFLEQFYRAMTIMRNEPYHNE